MSREDRFARGAARGSRQAGQSDPSRMRYSNVPEPLRGLGLTFIVRGLMVIGFMAFAGIQL